MAESPQPIPILIIGHSFVRRLQQFAITKGCANLALDPDMCHVKFHGVSGLKLMGLVQNRVLTSRFTCPKIIFIEIGTNDLASGVSPLALATNVTEYAKYLVAGQGAQIVVISQVVRRDALSCSYDMPKDFNERVIQYNNVVSKLVKDNPRIIFWRHRGLWAQWEAHLADGVHFNLKGQRKHYNSIRACLVMAMKRYATM